MRSQRRAVVTALSLLAAVACEDRPPTVPDPEETPRAARRGPEPPGQIWTSDDEYARVARAEVPGFAGLYFEDDGTPVILLKDHRQREAAERYLAPQLERARLGSPGAPRQAVVRKVPHDFADLKGWFDKLRPLLARDGVYMLDISEAGNGLFVGVRDETAIREVRREAARAGVPPGILKVEVRQRPGPRATLQDRTDILKGGYKIQGPPDSRSTRICSLGFNAVHQGVWIFVTNSHCTWTMFAYDGSTFTQPTYFAGNEIGTEMKDPPLFGCSGPIGLCRWSDAAYVRHNGQRGVGQGKIAYTTAATNGPAPDLTVRGEYNVVNRYTAAISEGTTFYKTGQASGTTYGKITMACVALGEGEGLATPSGTRYELLCQDVSTIWSQHGDSGSPVYYPVGNGQVWLYGILWGGPPSDYNTTWSTRLGNIEYDVGPVTALCVSGYNC